MILSDAADTSGAISSSREGRLRRGQWERPADLALVVSRSPRTPRASGRRSARSPLSFDWLGPTVLPAAIATSAFGSKRHSQSAIARRLLFEEPNKLSGSSRHIPQLAFPHRHHSPALFFERCDVTLISRPIPRQLGMPVVSICRQVCAHRHILDGSAKSIHSLTRPCDVRGIPNQDDPANLFDAADICNRGRGGVAGRASRASCPST